MQINPITPLTSNSNTRPAFGAKIGSGLKFLVKDDPRYEEFIKTFSTWGDSNSVVDIYNAKINGKTKYMLRLKSNVLDETTVPINKGQPEFMKKNLVNKFFELTPKSVLWAEDSLFKKVLDDARCSKPFWERLVNIMNGHKKEGIVFDSETAKRFKRM